MEKQSTLAFTWWHIAAALMAAAIVYSLPWPVTRPYWLMGDMETFYLLNGSLEGRPGLQIFWAVLSTRIFDVTAAILMILPFALYMRSTSPDAVLSKAAEGFYIAAVLFIVIFIAKEMDTGRLAHRFP